MKKSLTAGIDVGGTKVQTVVMENGLKVIGRGKRPTDIERPDRTKDDFMSAILGALEDACGKAGVSLGVLSAIGVGCAGQIERRTGDVLDSPHLKWNRFPLRRLLEKATGAPVSIVNDVQAAAWGEYSLGAGKGAKSLVCVFVGTGIGSGIVINGELYRGASGCAGEVGHAHYRMGGVRCQCGRRGCAEAYAGGESLWLRARSAIKRGVKSRITQIVGGNLDKIPASAIYQAAKEGDQLAKRLWRDVELAVGVICHNYVNLFNPDIMVLGGGIVEAAPELRNFARSYVDNRAVRPAAKTVKIVPPKLGSLSPAIGAADLAFRRL